MRNIHKTVIAAFCSGVFLAGLGTGIAFTEFSSFVYIGEEQLGEVEMVTRDFDYHFDFEEEQKLRVHTYYYENYNSNSLLLDPTVPENTVRYRVTYNANAVSPYLMPDEETYCLDDGEEVSQPYLVLRSAYLQDDFEIFMAGKDHLLKDIKNRRIASYNTVTIDTVKVLVNPASSDRIFLE